MDLVRQHNEFPPARARSPFSRAIVFSRNSVPFVADGAEIKFMRHLSGAAEGEATHAD
jgi:hypothetical protein